MVQKVGDTCQVKIHLDVKPQGFPTEHNLKTQIRFLPILSLDAMCLQLYHSFQPVNWMTLNGANINNSNNRKDYKKDFF